jgi:hypothetical protein
LEVKAVDGLKKAYTAEYTNKTYFNCSEEQSVYYKNAQLLSVSEACRQRADELSLSVDTILFQNSIVHFYSHILLHSPTRG